MRFCTILLYSKLLCSAEKICEITENSNSKGSYKATTFLFSAKFAVARQRAMSIEMRAKRAFIVRIIILKKGDT